MAYASPWSSGVPPGLQQHQQRGQQQVPQPLFNQPMGAFDISNAGAWQGQPPAAQQWVPAQPMQQVQFVPNPNYMQMQQHRQPIQQQHHNQRPMHQRPMFQQQKQRGYNRAAFVPQQQAGRQNGQQQQHQQQQQQQQNANKQQQQAVRKGTTKVTKVTKVKKQVVLKAKHKAAAGSIKVDKPATQNASKTGPATNDKPVVDAAAAKTNGQPPVKTQSKTAERKQLKLQARKNAESLKQSKLPIAKTNKVDGEVPNGNQLKADEPIEQAQLKCVPAVFGFICKLCDVFLRDKIARREHIESAEHMEKFEAFEREESEVKSDQAEVKEDPAEAKKDQAEVESDQAEVKNDQTPETRETSEP